MIKHKITVSSRRGVSDRSFSALCKKAAVSALNHAGIPLPCEIFILITDNEEIREINREHRRLDKPTDVLSFPMHAPDTDFGGMAAEKDPETGMLFLGDIIISAEKMREQAEEYGHGTGRELSFLTVHAVLHLLGHDHKADRDTALMRKAEEEILETMGFRRE